ncbi:MAG: type IV pili methyl-accepting chemotaxis transducer N-terminal domain-containing protein [Deltaproteobacteria bacterium]|nr:type IV pili methyl-accepting chemotaxis transducer N-terminal domain-containing protein [Deltaproteobacteria bacterium]
MRLTLRARFGLIFFAPIACVLAMVVSLAGAAGASRSHAHSIRVASRGRLLAAELVAWVGMVGEGQDEAREGLAQRVAELDLVLASLEGGDAVDGPPAPPIASTARAALGALREAWPPARDSIARLLAARAPARLDASLAAQTRLQVLGDRSEELLLAVEGASADQLRRVLLAHAALGALMALAWAGGALLLQRALARRLRELKAIGLVPDESVSNWITGSENDELSALVRRYSDQRARLEDLEQAQRAALVDVARYKMLFDNSRDALMTLEPPTWSFTAGNPAAVELFRARSEAEFVSNPPWHYSPPIQADGRPSGEKAKEMIESAMRKGSHLFSWTHCRLGGEPFPASVLLSRVSVGGVTFLQATVRDETELHRALTRAAEGDRLAAVGTLAAGIAHEINTPIQFVNDSVHFLREAAADTFALVEALRELRQRVEAGAGPDALREAVEAAVVAEQSADLEYLLENTPKAFDRCVDGVERVATIVRSMKEFAHPPDLDMAPADLNRAIESTLTIARNEYKYVAELEVDLGELPPVTCFVNDVNQVVLNLVVNAAHAIGDVIAGTEAKGKIQVRTYTEDDHAVIAIRDTGGGIPDEIRHRIFEPFFTTKAVGKGTGQGLAHAWAVITEKHGGQLSFSSLMGRGTTFYVRLPVAGKKAKRKLSSTFDGTTGAAA